MIKITSENNKTFKFTITYLFSVKWISLAAKVGQHHYHTNYSPFESLFNLPLTSFPMSSDLTSRSLSQSLTSTEKSKQRGM